MKDYINEEIKNLQYKKELCIKLLNKGKEDKTIEEEALEKTILEYSKEIILHLENNTLIINNVLNELEITEKDFFDYLSGEKKCNIALYDQALCLVKTKSKRK